MTVVFSSPEQTNDSPHSGESHLKEAISFMDEQLKQEIERGNDLCQIIFKLVRGHGPKGEFLEMYEIDCIARIMQNIDRKARTT